MDVEAFERLLWPAGDGLTTPQVYALLDGARCAGIVPLLLASGLEKTCLFAGPLSPTLRCASPWLVHLSPGTDVALAVLSRGWHDHWGVVVIAEPDVTLPVLRRHFRSLLRVRDDQGRLLMFRFYDPRVMAAYLAACDPAQRRRLFGPASGLVPMGTDPAAAQACLGSPPPSHAVDPTPVIIDGARMEALLDLAQADFRHAVADRLCGDTPAAAQLPPGELDAVIRDALHAARLCQVRVPAVVQRVVRQLLSLPQPARSPAGRAIAIGLMREAIDAEARA